MKNGILSSCKLIVMSALLITFVMIPPSAFSADNKYAVITLNGSVNPIVAEYIVDALKKASDEGNQFIILRMDTPGGLMDSMRDIIKSILTSPVRLLCIHFRKGHRPHLQAGLLCFHLMLQQWHLEPKLAPCIL